MSDTTQVLRKTFTLERTRPQRDTEGWYQTRAGTLLQRRRKHV